MGESVVLALRLAADYWRADPARAKLLLEGGPSLGSEGHLRLVHEIAGVLARQAGGARPGKAVERQAHAHALIGLGLGIELGRLIVAQPDASRRSTTCCVWSAAPSPPAPEHLPASRQGVPGSALRQRDAIADPMP